MSCYCGWTHLTFDAAVVVVVVVVVVVAADDFVVVVVVVVVVAVVVEIDAVVLVKNCKYFLACRFWMDSNEAVLE